jgi:hypothetical protein
MTSDMSGGAQASRSEAQPSVLCAQPDSAPNQVESIIMALIDTTAPQKQKKTPASEHKARSHRNAADRPFVPVLAF